MTITRLTLSDGRTVTLIDTSASAQGHTGAKRTHGHKGHKSHEHKHEGGLFHHLKELRETMSSGKE